ncbi:hypothetical protein ACHAW5_002484 [Stephanodiscus triporus]|uniref:Mitochondrial glycoprotein n=1 Tax=Stephanodiscus triporus TaxID=2934178 RepID=A0ABD3QK37_9STRA
MIRSNILARRIAASVAKTTSSSSASFAVDALVARSASAASAVIVPNLPRRSADVRPSSSSSPPPPSSRHFSSSSSSSSSDVATRLGSVLQREIDEETEAAAEYGGGVPPELVELRSTIASRWTILEGITGIGSGSETGSGATVRMLRKEAGSKGAKIGIVFHCQDTEEDSNFDTDDLFDEGKREEEEDEVEEEPAQAVRFGVVVSKGGRTVVIQCRSGYEVSVDGVTVRDGDMESVMVGLAGGEGLHAALYQGPEFTELAEDLQESFQNYVVKECGVDEDVTAFISMYCDHREQEEYVSWMKTAIEILD